MSAGVASSGGIGLGDGPSVGGQRPRNNNFNVEGVDNNRKDVTGHNLDIPNEAVAEFSMLQNQYSAEFGNGSGGQFNNIYSKSNLYWSKSDFGNEFQSYLKSILKDKDTEFNSIINRALNSESGVEEFNFENSTYPQ